jgi:hypothetical protein
MREEQADGTARQQRPCAGGRNGTSREIGEKLITTIPRERTAGQAFTKETKVDKEKIKLFPGRIRK